MECGWKSPDDQKLSERRRLIPCSAVFGVVVIWEVLTDREFRERF